MKDETTSTLYVPTTVRRRSLRRRYRIGFWIIALLFGISFVTQLIERGVFSIPALIPILAGVALYRDWQLRKKTSVYVR